MVNLTIGSYLEKKSKIPLLKSKRIIILWIGNSIDDVLYTKKTKNKNGSFKWTSNKLIDEKDNSINIEYRAYVIKKDNIEKKYDVVGNFGNFVVRELERDWKKKNEIGLMSEYEYYLNLKKKCQIKSLKIDKKNKSQEIKEIKKRKF